MSTASQERGLPTLSPKPLAPLTFTALQSPAPCVPTALCCNAVTAHPGPGSIRASVVDKIGGMREKRDGAALTLGLADTDTVPVTIRVMIET